MEAKQLVRPIVSILLVGSSLAALYNVMADDTALRKRASEAACGESEVVDPWRVGRYPIWQSYGFRCPSGSVDVSCTRSLYLFGEYACAWDSGNAPPSRQRAAASARPTSSAPSPRTPASTE